MIKSKKLKRKAESALKKLQEITVCNGMLDLQFENQPPKVKNYFHNSIDFLIAFIENIDKKPFNS